jgi:hypothetical protein
MYPIENLKLALEVLKENFESHIGGISVCSKTSNSIVNYSSIFLSINLIAQTLGRPVNKSLVIIGIVLYLAILVLAAFINHPTGVSYPILPEWDVIMGAIVTPDTSEAYMRLMSGYVEVIKDNQPAIDQKHNLTIILKFVFFMLVIILAAALIF